MGKKWVSGTRVSRFETILCGCGMEYIATGATAATAEEEEKKTLLASWGWRERCEHLNLSMGLLAVRRQERLPPWGFTWGFHGDDSG